MCMKMIQSYLHKAVSKRLQSLARFAVQGNRPSSATSNRSGLLDLTAAGALGGTSALRHSLAPSSPSCPSAGSLFMRRRLRVPEPGDLLRVSASWARSSC